MKYEETIQKIIETLENSKFAVLATANKKGVVSASQMTIYNDGLTVFFQTDNHFEKARNIRENPYVAINLGALYLKGIAKITGHPRQNPIFIEKIKTKHTKTYENYTDLPNEILIEVELIEARIWGIDNGKDIHQQETIQVIDFKNHAISEIICDKM